LRTSELKPLLGRRIEQRNLADVECQTHLARQPSGALWRQAVGWDQHHSMDVFAPVAARLPVADIGTLDELAVALFGR